MPSDVMTPDEFLEAADVSRETLEILKRYVDLLRLWNVTTNLVAASTLPDVWRRHILDSAQLLRFVPETAKRVVDLGSGAGLPGMVLAVLLRSRAECQVMLIESSARKCAFLRTAIRTTQSRAELACVRVEACERQIADVVTARALAPLVKLLELAEPFMGATTRCIFPKGRNVDAELTEATKYWNMDVRQFPSMTDPESRVLCLEGIRRV